MSQQNPSEIATFAGGCFWCTQQTFDGVKGVLRTTVGYTGGTTPHPTYKEVCTGKTGHVEAIQLEYDPTLIRYQELLEIYWNSIDPARSDGQFCDIGPQYRPLIFTHNDTQRHLAEAFIHARIAAGERVQVDIQPAGPFYPAEEDHQQYYKKNPLRYQLYKDHSGR